MDISTRVKLNNGVEMPILGLGVYLLGNGKRALDALNWALDAGYRHFDTAAMYGNEKEVGQAVRESTIPREELFVTTKLWNDDHGFKNALRGFEESYEQLGLDHVDLYLIHWPVERLRSDSWKALEKLFEEGRCRAIGVSNFTIVHLEELIEKGNVIPAVNQVEFNPWLYQKDLLEYCESKGIALEAYSPLTKGRRMDHPDIRKVSKKYDVTPAQVMIRWVLQHGVIVIPKSGKKGRIHENSDVFGFELSKEDMDHLDSLDENFRTTWDPTNVQ